TGCRRPASKAEQHVMSASTSSSTTTANMPVIFLAHGSPLLLDDAAWVRELGAWAGAMPRPKAVLMLSAHWLDQPVTLGATRPVPLVYDFYGFPGHYYADIFTATAAPAPGGA